MKKRYYIEIASIVAIHSVLSWAILLLSTKTDWFLLSMGLPMGFSIFSALVFLYIFTHDKVLKIARLIEQKEGKIEEKWLKRFRHRSRIFTTVAIGVFGGVILGALTARILLARHNSKYYAVIASSIISTLFYVFFVRRILGWVV